MSVMVYGQRPGPLRLPFGRSSEQTDLSHLRENPHNRSIAAHFSFHVRKRSNYPTAIP